MDEWTSVNDTLPENNVLLTIYVKSKTDERGYITFDKNTDISKNTDPDWEITHWMYGYKKRELPSPPSQDNKEQDDE